LKRILWISRYPILQSQRKALLVHFGFCNIIEDPRPFDTAEDIKRRFNNGNFDELVVVAPLSVIVRLCELGLRPLWAEMKQVSREEAEVYAAGHYYRFKRFRRIKGMRIDFTDIEEGT